MRVLLVDDDDTLRTALVGQLRRAGLSVDEAAGLARADEQLAVNAYDVAVFDRQLPEGDATEYVERLRAAGNALPVIFLTCFAEVSDRVRGFEAGGDDYLGKPCAAVELIARIRAVGRRGGVALPPVLTLGDLRIDQARTRAQRGGRPLTLTPKEYALLEHLVRNANRAVSRQELLEHCWDEFEDPSSNVVEARIARLRVKLGTPEIINTVRGVGYLASAATGPA